MGIAPLHLAVLLVRRAVLHLPVVRVQREGRRPHLWRELPGHQVRLRQGGPGRDHAALRRPVRAQLHLLRHDHQTGAAGELAL